MDSRTIELFTHLGDGRVNLFKGNGDNVFITVKKYDPATGQEIAPDYIDISPTLINTRIEEVESEWNELQAIIAEVNRVNGLDPVETALEIPVRRIEYVEDGGEGGK